MAASSGTLTVKNINKFAINKILLIGELGEENSEIIKTHASSAPSGSTITLASSTVYAHSAGTKVYIIQYDQVELSHTTTTTGSKTTLTTTLGTGLAALEADDPQVVYQETEYTSGYYFARFKDSIAGTFSDYSDPLPYGGWASNQVGYLVDIALRRNSTGFTDRITRPFCYQEINSCLQLTQGKLKRFPQYQKSQLHPWPDESGVNTVPCPRTSMTPRPFAHSQRCGSGTERTLSPLTRLSLSADLVQPSSPPRPPRPA